MKFNCTTKLPKVFELRNNTRIKYSRHKRRLLKGRDRNKKKEEHKQEQPKLDEDSGFQNTTENRTPICNRNSILKSFFSKIKKLDDLSDMYEGKKQNLYCGGVVKPRRWRETRNRLTHKQSAHGATHEVVELGSWEGREGTKKDGPWFWPLTRQIREHESLNTNTDPLCVLSLLFKYRDVRISFKSKTQMR